ncbi:MAG: ribosome biogenesis GTPase Der, partial [Muribaculaceae bacterium]|nr:ribosome biogenesis GTPase Der [Muribaculaceae bacterium]
FGSALTKQRILRVLEEAISVYNKRKTVISTSQVNNVLLEAIGAVPPPAIKGKYVKIKYITMLKEARVPSFVFFCNLPQWIKDPYKRYLENKIREKWDFCGTPINLYFRQK